VWRVWKELQIGRWGRSGRWRRGCRRGSGSTRGTTSSCSTTSSTGSPAAAMTAVASPCPTSTSTSASHGTFQVCLSLNTSFFLYILDLKSIIPPKKNRTRTEASFLCSGTDRTRAGEKEKKLIAGETKKACIWLRPGSNRRPSVC
jgi:hypothetical protein